MTNSNTSSNNKLKKQANVLRIFRKIHRKIAIFLFAFFFLISVSGLLLAWKKNSSGLILPKTYIGTSTDFKDWLPIDSLHKNACEILHDSISNNLSLKLNRIDIRKNKGIVKFIFAKHYWSIQLDGATGKLLHIVYRYSDLIENIHDGSILDKIADTKNEIFKLIYTTIIGFSLLTFVITGFWLWHVPKKIKKRKLNTNK